MDKQEDLLRTWPRQAVGERAVPLLTRATCGMASRGHATSYGWRSRGRLSLTRC